MLEKLEGELADVETAREAAHVSERDAAALVDYVIQVVTHAGTLWRDATPEQRGPLQAFLFPAGLQWTKAGLFEHHEPAFCSTSCGQAPARNPEWGASALSVRTVVAFLRAAERLQAILPVAA